MNLDPSTWPALLWLVVAVALLAGYALGALLSRRGQNVGRVRELERQLDETRDEFDAYREQVSGHFTETSKHLRDLALQYRTVYEHLADGARTLCPDSAVPIEARGLAEELLPAGLRGEGGEPQTRDTEPAAEGDSETRPEGGADERATDLGEDADPVESEPASRS